MAKSDWDCLITCEHAVNTVPTRYRRLFSGAQSILSSHRGYDPGALNLARTFASCLDAPLFAGKTTRLLVELNRSLHHKSLWSEFTRDLAKEEQQAILDQWYSPYRESVTSWIAESLSRGRSVLHLSVHTFTAVLNGEPRSAEIGLLYDPRRIREKEFCARWKTLLIQSFPEFRIRRNYPYRGLSDGFTTQLRREFSAARYLGIELEVNQAVAMKWSSRKSKPTVRMAETFQRAQL